MLRLKHERLRLGWSQTVLAFHAQMSVGDISKIESRWLRPYPSQLEKLAGALRVDRDALLEEVRADDRTDLATGEPIPAVEGR